MLKRKAVRTAVRLQGEGVACGWRLISRAAAWEKIGSLRLQGREMCPFWPSACQTSPPPSPSALRRTDTFLFMLPSPGRDFPPSKHNSLLCYLGVYMSISFTGLVNIIVPLQGTVPAMGGACVVLMDRKKDAWLLQGGGQVDG